MAEKAIPTVPSLANPSLPSTIFPPSADEKPQEDGSEMVTQVALVTGPASSNAQPEKDEHHLTETEISSSNSIDDDLYKELKRCFLMSGKGRRPNLPHIPICTNRLLMQLDRLRVEGGNSVSFSNVEDWFLRLFPDTCFPLSKLKGVIQRCVLKAEKLSEEERSEMLNQVIDLNQIDDVLSSIGITWKTLRNPEQFCPSPDTRITNAVVVSLECLRIKEGWGPSFVSEWLQKLNKSLTIDRKVVTKIISGYKTISRNKSRYPDKYRCFLEMDSLTGDRQLDSSSTISKSASPVLSEISSTAQQLASSTLKKELLAKKYTVELEKEKDKLTNHNSFLQYSLDGANKTITFLTKDLATATSKEEKTTMKLQESTEKRQSLEKENKTLRKEISSIKRKKLYKRFVRLKKKIKSSQENLHRSKEKAIAMVKERECLRQKQQEKQKKITALQKEMWKLKDKINALEEQLGIMQDLNVIDVPEIQHSLATKNKGEYTDAVRQTVLKLQGDGNVAASKCGQVIKIVAKHLFNVTLRDCDVPCTQTILNIADEGHVVSKIQTAETILEHNTFTLHTDGTSRDKNTVVGQQITLDSGLTLTLGFRTVATEDAATLVDITVEMLKELQDLYCALHADQEKDDVFKSLLKRLNAFMSDRAAVQKSFNSKMLQFIRSETGTDVFVHFLYCNAHYLLGLSRAVECALQKVEKAIIDMDEEHTPLGRDKDGRFKYFTSSDSAVARLIRMTCDVLGPRGDEKNGCRAEWLAFCEEEGIQSLLTSFRGNRFNNFFQGAAAVIHHEEAIKSFFTSGGLSHSNLKLQSVAADLADAKLTSLVCAVGLLYLRVTAPYWNLLQSKVPYVQFHTYVQALLSHLENWCQDASPLTCPGFGGIFDGEFELTSPLTNAVLNKAECCDATVKPALQDICKEMVLTTKRQLADFLQDGMYGKTLSDDIVEEMKSFPLTNLLGEHVFGDMDFDMQKRRHASTHHRSTTVMLKRNKTGDWLDTKTKNETTAIMKVARKEAKSLRAKHKLQEKIVRIQIRERAAEIERQKQQKAEKLAAEKQMIIDAIEKQGGPCRTPQDLERVAQLPLKDIKDQIRFQKIVLGHGTSTGLKITGNKETLLACLRKHFTAVTGLATEAEFQPLRKRQRTVSESSDTEGESETSGESEAEDAECVDSPFTYERQGQWVGVYYDDNFYLGQVINITSPETADIKFLEKTKGRSDYYRYPSSEMISEVSARYVFRWDFEVEAASSDCRVWSVPGVKTIVEHYQRIKKLSQ